MTNKRPAIIICGPTASGKSGFALTLAAKINGAVINADSMQVYSGISLLTASPSENDKTKAPHYLYNFLSPLEQYSVGSFLNDLAFALDECISKNYIPLIIGGTGMYINAIMEGVSIIPQIEKSLREEILNIVGEKGIEYLYKKLEETDKNAASRLNSTDTYRIIRAYEVIKQTGKSILEYQKINTESLLTKFDTTTFYLRPERNFLYQTCNDRFEFMIQNGGLEEVEKFMKLYPNISVGAIKALGVREIKCYLNDEINFEEAINQAKTKTRQYAKRQITWFNNQLTWDHQIISYASLEEYKYEISKLIRLYN